MKPIIKAGIILLTCLISESVTGQKVEKKDSTILIQKMKKEFDRINMTKLTSISVETNNLEGVNCAAPWMEIHLVYYYEGKNLVKIISEGAEDHAEWKEEYYFRNGKLFLIDQNNASGSAINPTATSYHNRYYIHNDLVIKSIETKSSEIPEDRMQMQINMIKALYKTTDKNKIAEIISCGVD